MTIRPNETIAMRAYQELYERRPEFFPFVPLEGMKLARCRAWFAMLIGKSDWRVWTDDETHRPCFGRQSDDPEQEVYICDEGVTMDEAMVAAVEIGWSPPFRSLEDLEALIRSVFANLGLPPPPAAKREELVTWDVNFIPGIGKSPEAQGDGGAGDASPA